MIKIQYATISETGKREKQGNDNYTAVLMAVE